MRLVVKNTSKPVKSYRQFARINVKTKFRKNAKNSCPFPPDKCEIRGKKINHVYPVGLSCGNYTNYTYTLWVYPVGSPSGNYHE